MARTNLIILYAKNIKEAYVLLRNEQHILAIGYDLSDKEDFAQLNNVGNLAGARNFILECSKQKYIGKEKGFQRYGVSYDLSDDTDVQQFNSIMQQVQARGFEYQKKSSKLHNRKLEEPALIAV